jgi:hypothetical protein
VFGTCFAQETLNNCECAGSRNGTIATENWWRDFNWGELFYAMN